MDDHDIAFEKIKSLQHQLQQRDSEINSLKKQLLQLRSNNSDKNVDKSGKLGAISDIPEASEKEIQKRVTDEIERREKKFNEKLRDLQIKYEKELFTAKQMYDSVANKVESAMVQERTIEAMTRDIKILEDEKKNLKLLHMEILKQNQIEFEIKHAEAKKKMIEEIKKVQHNVSVSYLQQMDNSQKLTFLRNNQLEKEIDYRSVRMEEINLKNEMYEKKIFKITEENENLRNTLVKTTEKNLKMGEIIRKLNESLIKCEQDRKQEIEKLCILCEIDPQKLQQIIIETNDDNSLNVIISRTQMKSDSSRKNKSNSLYNSKKKKSRSKSKIKNKNKDKSGNADNQMDDDCDLRQNNLEMNNNQKNYNSNEKNKRNYEIIEDEKKLKISMDINTIKENENENEYSYYKNNTNENINNLNTNGNLEEAKKNFSQNIINGTNEVYSEILNNNNDEKNNHDNLPSTPNSSKNAKITPDMNRSSNHVENENNILVDKSKSTINKDSFSKEIKPLSLPQMGNLQKASSSSLNNLNINNSLNIRSQFSNSQIKSANGIRNRDFISNGNVINSLIFNNNNKNNNINANLIENNGNNLNTNLHASQINPILNGINKSINYSCNRTTGFSRENNLYQVYEIKIKSLESQLKEKEKDYFKLKFSFDNLIEKLTNYEKKFYGIISLYEAGLKKLIDEEASLKKFKIVDFNFDFSTLKDFEFQRLTNENKFNLLVFLLNQIIPMVNLNDLQSEFIKQNISMFKVKVYEEKIKDTASKDKCFRNSVTNFTNIKNLREGKNPMNYVNNTLRNMHYNASSVGNIISRFKDPINFLKDEKYNLNKKLHMYNHQVID